MVLKTLEFVSTGVTDCVPELALQAACLSFLALCEASIDSVLFALQHEAWAQQQMPSSGSSADPSTTLDVSNQPPSKTPKQDPDGQLLAAARGSTAEVPLSSGLALLSFGPNSGGFDGAISPQGLDQVQQ